MRQGKISLTFAFALIVSAQTAGADGWRLALPATAVPGGYVRNVFYIEPTFEYQWRALGRFQTGAVSATDPTPLFRTKVNVQGIQPGLTLGMRLPDTWAPAWVGQNLRVEVSGVGFDLNQETSATFLRFAPGGQFVRVGGGPAFATGSTFGFDYRAEMTGFETALRIASDIALWPNLTLTPAVAFFGGRSLTRYRMILVDQCGGGTCFNDTIRERVRTVEYGATFSLGARYAVMSGLSLTLGGGVSIVQTHARMNAVDCFDGNALLGDCQSAFSTSTSASLNRLGYRLFGEGGLGFDLGIAKIDLLGGIRYSSVVPEVRNPAVAFQSATLGSLGQFGYTAHVRVTVPFNIY